MSKIKVSLLIQIILFGFVANIHAQDVHYSQRLAGDKQNNPAFINDYIGTWQAMTVYRQQWQSIGVPFNSTSLFYTRKAKTALSTLQLFGGIMYTNDKSGDAKLTANRIALNIGAEYRIDEHFVSLAFSNAFVAKSFDENGLTFPSQYDRNIGGFNETLNNGENFRGEQLGYYDLGIGALWKLPINVNWQLTSGFSVSHITEPQESFFEENNRKNRGYGVQFLGKRDMNEKVTVLPYVSFYRAKGASETLIGSTVSFNTSSLGPIDRIKPFTYFRTGIDRLTDALIVGSRAEVGQFELGLSYDLNVSELEFASNYKGGFEITLIYTAKEVGLTKRRIPCERY